MPLQVSLMLIIALHRHMTLKRSWQGSGHRAARSCCRRLRSVPKLPRLPVIARHVLITELPLCSSVRMNEQELSTLCKNSSQQDRHSV